MFGVADMISGKKTSSIISTTESIVGKMYFSSQSTKNQFLFQTTTGCAIKDTNHVIPPAVVSTYSDEQKTTNPINKIL